MQPEKAINLLEEVLRLDSEYVFPFRRETISIMENAVKLNSNWKLKYYLALNYWSKGRFHEALELMEACKQEPDLFAFYLSRADLSNKLNKDNQLHELNKAKSLAPNEWRIDDRLIAYYLEKGENEKALNISQPNKPPRVAQLGGLLD